MNRFLVSLLASASLFTAASCSSDSSSSATDTVTTPTGTAADSTAGHAGGHTYACPMHPEVTSTTEGDKCPKCGMALVHNDQVSNGKTYQMRFEPKPRQLVAGQPVTLTFTPQEAGNEKAPVPLAVVHEKKIHLIVVRKDLSAFYHEHPEYTAEGNYRVPSPSRRGATTCCFRTTRRPAAATSSAASPLRCRAPSTPRLSSARTRCSGASTATRPRFRSTRI
jgi:hypothetical protein